jgi:hypothetical protein
MLPQDLPGDLPSFLERFGATRSAVSTCCGRAGRTAFAALAVATRGRGRTGRG